jgi:hypothetical protein
MPHSLLAVTLGLTLRGLCGAEGPPCPASILLSSPAITGLGTSAPETAAKYSLGRWVPPLSRLLPRYRLLGPATYQHYDGGRFLHRDGSGRWIYSSQPGADDLNRLEGSGGEAPCPTDSAIQWRFNRATTLERWKLGSVDTTFKVEPYVSVAAQNSELLREVRETLGQHTAATGGLGAATAQLGQNQDTTNDLLALIKTNLEISSMGRSDTNSLLREINAGLEKTQERTENLTRAMSSETEALVKKGLDSNTKVLNETNRLLGELAKSLDESQQAGQSMTPSSSNTPAPEEFRVQLDAFSQNLTADLNEMKTTLAAISTVASSYLKADTMPADLKEFLASMKAVDTEPGAAGHYDLHKCATLCF